MAKASAGGAGRGKVGRTILTSVDSRFDVVCEGVLWGLEMVMLPLLEMGETVYRLEVVSR